MTENNIILISIDCDGRDHSVSQMTKAEFLKLMNMDVEEHNDLTFAKSDKEIEINTCGYSYIVIEGRIIQPKPKTITTKYCLDEEDENDRR